jgi:hypothetical protein
MAVIRGVLLLSNVKEILSQQAARSYTLMVIKLTERSDIHKYSICNLQFSIPACPDQWDHP